MYIYFCRGQQVHIKVDHNHLWNSNPLKFSPCLRTLISIKISSLIFLALSLSQSLQFWRRYLYVLHVGRHYFFDCKFFIFFRSRYKINYAQIAEKKKRTSPLLSLKFLPSKTIISEKISTHSTLTSIPHKYALKTLKLSRLKFIFQ